MRSRSRPTCSQVCPRLPVDNSDDLALATRLWAELPRTGTLLLGAGRLTLALTTAMTSDPPVRHGLTVVTNSLDAAIAAARISKLAVYNIGGSVSPANRAQEGDWALHELERLHVDVSLVCPAGISLERGLGQPTPVAAAISRAEVACGKTVIALADASYLGAAGLRTVRHDHRDRPAGPLRSAFRRRRPVVPGSRTGHRGRRQLHRGR